VSATPQLDVLRCQGCSAPLALADAATIRCPSCGSETAVPAAHREAFEKMHHDSASRNEANALYARLGRPPRMLRVIGVMFDPSGVTRPLTGARSLLLRGIGWYYKWVLLVFGPFIMLVAAILAINLLMRAIGAHYHANVIETLPASTRDWIQMPIPVAAALAGTALGVYGRRTAISRQRLQAALAALAPQHEGGPSSCRACGAPLSVTGEALGVRCIYCGADNLVALPQAWLARLGAKTAAVDREITVAGSELARQQAQLRRSLWIRVGAVVIFVGAIVAIGLATGSDSPRTESVPPSWPPFADDPRPLVRRDVELVHGQRVLSDKIKTLAFAGKCPAPMLTLGIPGEDCDGGTCTLRLYAALRAGEIAEWMFGFAPSLKVHVERHEGYPWPNVPAASFGVPVGDFDGAAATFIAPWSAWYELAVTVPAPAALTMCFAVHP
jgi:DNA-directed RNA polymerase subunit RPC12/RpoP